MGLATDMARLRDEIESMREARRSTLSTLREEVSHLSDDVQRSLKETRENRLASAEMDRSRRQEQLQEIFSEVQNRRAESQELLQRFRTELELMAERSKDDRREFIERSVVLLQRLKEETQEQLNQFHLERLSQRDSDVAERQHYMAQISSDVHAITDSAKTLLRQFRDEMDMTRELWHSLRSLSEFAPEEPQAKPESTPKTRTNVAKAEPSKPKSVKVQRVDDLEKIVGVGPSTKRVLNQAGVTNFAHLAGASADDLNAILGDLSRFANVDHWIRQANAILESEG